MGAMTDEVGLVEVALRIAQAAPYGFVVTDEPAGPPSGRLVQHLEVTDDLVLTFSTSPTSRKAARISSSGRATYLIEDRQSFAYLSLSGTAHLVSDIGERNRLWEEGLRAFFPHGPEGDEFVLVRLRADRLELWSIADGVHPEPYGLLAASLERSGDGAWRTRLRSG